MHALNDEQIPVIEAGLWLPATPRIAMSETHSREMMMTVSWYWNTIHYHFAIATCYCLTDLLCIIVQKYVTMTYRLDYSTVFRGILSLDF